MRVLILTSSTGGGHDMRARSFDAWAGHEKTRHLDLEVEIHQTLEHTARVYHWGVELYNWIQRYHPNLHHVYFNCLEAVPPCRSKSFMFNVAVFREVLETLDPQVIVSVHPTLNHGFFEIARDTLGRGAVRCITYCGELHGGYGFSRNWVNPNADLFIGAVRETCEAARALGMEDEKNWPGGFLLSPDFYAAPFSSDERSSFISNELGLDPAIPILLLSTGGKGANNHAAFLKVLEGVTRPLQVVAVCGRCSATLQRMEEWRPANKLLRVKALGLRSDMHRLMQVAWAIVARGGTGTTSETIMTGCPLIINGLGGVMPQERITTKFCAKHQFGPRLRKAVDLLPIIQSWLDDPEKYLEVRENVIRSRPEHDPVELLEKVAGMGTLTRNVA